MPKGWFLGGVPLPKLKNLCKFQDQNLRIYGRLVECVFICLQCT